LRRDLEWAADFGRRHPAGWTYLVDTGQVRFINPANLLVLRRVKQLPNLTAYIVIIPSRIVRLASGALAPILTPDAVVATIEEATVPGQHRAPRARESPYPPRRDP
jgi:hypothetical protein